MEVGDTGWWWVCARADCAADGGAGVRSSLDDREYGQQRQRYGDGSRRCQFRGYLVFRQIGLVWDPVRGKKWRVVNSRLCVHRHPRYVFGHVSPHGIGRYVNARVLIVND